MAKPCKISFKYIELYCQDPGTSEGSINGSHHPGPSASASSREHFPWGLSGQVRPAPAALVPQRSRQVAQHLGARAPKRAGARAGWRTRVPPGGSPPSFHTPGAGEISGPGYWGGDLRRGRGRQHWPRPGEGFWGCPLPRRESPQGRSRRRGPRAARDAAAKTRRGGSERARSQLLRGPAAELGMLSAAAAPPSANSEARAPGPWGRERRRRRAGVARRPQTVANFAASPELSRTGPIPYK